MIWLEKIPILAEFPAELLIWIVIGIVWAIAQVFAKKNKERQESQSFNEPRRTEQYASRPSVNTDPVSPNDELRNFLRKISGETDEPEQVQSEPPAPPPLPQTPLRSAPERRAPQRSQQMRSVAESRRHSRPTPQPLRSTPPTPPPPRQRPQPSATGYQRVRPPVKTTAGKTRGKLKPAFLQKRQSTAKPLASGFGNWQAAVLHREILGPPRALRPYSPNEFQ